MTAPRPASRASLAHAGNRLLYAVAAAWILSWLTATGTLRLGLFLAAVGVGYALLTVLHNTRNRPTNTPEETP